MKKVIYSFLALGLILSSFSCQNFLNGSNLKEEIEIAILEASSNFKLKSITPLEQMGGVPKDSPITITFSTAVDRKSFENGFSIKSSNGKDLSAHFAGKGEIQYSTDGTVVTISAKGDNPIDSSSVSAVVIELASSIKGANGDSFTGYKHTYSINSNTDAYAPIVYNLTASKNSKLIKEGKVYAEGNFNQLKNVIFPQSTDEVTDYYTCQLFIDYEFYDESSGVKSLNFSEKLLYDLDGKSYDNAPVVFSYVISDKACMGTIKGTYAYTFNSDSIDGIVEVTVSASDYAGHESAKKTYTVIRHTVYSNTDKPLSITNCEYSGESTTPEWWYTGDSEDQKVSMLYNHYAKKYLQVLGFGRTEWINFDGKSYLYNPTKCEISIKAGTKAGVYDIEFPLVEYADYFDGDGKYDTTVYAVDKSSLSTDKGYYLELKVTDPSGCETVREEYLAPTPKLSKIEKHEYRNEYYIYASHPLTDEYNLKALISENPDFLESTIDSITKDPNSDNDCQISVSGLSSDKTYYFALTCSTEDGKLISGLSDVYELKVNNTTSTNKSVPSYTFESNGINSKSYRLTVKKPRSNADSAYISVIQSLMGDKTESAYFFSDESNELSIDLVTDEQAQKYSFYYNEVKDGVIYKSNTKSLVFDDGDNIPPSVNYISCISGYFDISVSDYVNNNEWESYKSLVTEGEDSTTITVYYRIGSKFDKKLSEEEIKKLPSKRLKGFIDVENEEVTIEPFSFEDFGDKQGKYIFYIYVEDKSHNYSFYEFETDVIDNNWPVYMTQIDSSNSRVYFDTFDYKDNSKFEVYRMSSSSIKQRWRYFGTKYYGGTYSSTNFTPATSDVNCTKAYASLSNLKGYFIKVQSYDGKKYSGYNYYYVGADICCTLKKLTEKSSSGGLKKYLIEHNEPVFVETVYGSYNYGDNIAKWNRWIAEEHRLNYQIFDTGSTVDEYSVSEMDIPSGNYYAVIVHYADGTSDISDVYYKD